MKKLSLSSESAVTSGLINISINGDTIADPLGIAFIKKLEFINPIVLDNYTFSIDGEIVGDPVDIRVKKRLSLPESDLSYGAFTVSVNGEAVGDPVGIPFIKKLTLGKDRLNKVCNFEFTLA